jgi:hypothetical protein
MPQTSGEEHVRIRIDTGALLGNFLGEAQKLLDIVTLTFTGLEAVTEEEFGNALAFFSFQPASNRRQPFPDVKRNSAQWLLTAFLSDCVDVVGRFLEECREVCAFYRLHSKEIVHGADYLAIRGPEKKRFHRLGFPIKLDHLRDEFGVETPLERHFLSMNKARNCLVHRGGVVCERDCNDGDALSLEWRTLQIVAKPKNGEEQVVDRDMSFEAETKISVRSVDVMKQFHLGEKIALEPKEIYQCVSTLHGFGSTVVRSVEDYGRSQGIVFDRNMTPQTLEWSNRHDDRQLGT